MAKALLDCQVQLDLRGFLVHVLKYGFALRSFSVTDDTVKIQTLTHLETLAKVAVVNSEIKGNNEMIHIGIERLTLSLSTEQLKDLLNLFNTVVGGENEKKQLVNTLINLVKTVVGK